MRFMRTECNEDRRLGDVFSSDGPSTATVESGSFLKEESRVCAQHAPYDTLTYLRPDTSYNTVERRITELYHPTTVAKSEATHRIASLAKSQ